MTRQSEDDQTFVSAGKMYKGKVVMCYRYTRWIGHWVGIADSGSVFYYCKKLKCMEVCLLKSPKEKTVSGNNVTHTLSSCCHGEEPRQRKISVAVANLDHIIVSAGAKTLHHSCDFIPHLNPIITCLQNIISGPGPKLMFVTFGSFQMFSSVTEWFSGGLSELSGRHFF